jgi:small neutral amino acid transporter SnatA (MarC family)
LRRAQVSAAVPKVHERDGRAAVGRVVGLLQAHMGVD